VTGTGQGDHFDLKTLKVTGEAKADKDADCVIYDPASKRVFAMNGDPHSSTVIDAKSGNVVGTIELGGGPEFAVADGKGTVYVNLEDKSELVAIDSLSLKIKSRWPVAPAGAPTALAMDVQHHRLFSAGRNPQMLVVLDSDSGKVVQSFPISGGVDAAAYEPETGLIFASTREGMVHVFHEDSPDKFSGAETIKTEIGAKTMASTPRRTNCFWTLPTSRRLQRRPRSSRIRVEHRFWNVSHAGLRAVNDFQVRPKRQILLCWELWPALPKRQLWLFQSMLVTSVSTLAMKESKSFSLRRTPSSK